MKVSSKNVLGILASALMAGGLLVACPGPNAADAGSTTGGSGGTGGSCGAATAVCTVSSECCTGLSCNGGFCSAACSKVTGPCSASSPCCSGLTCDTSGDANNNTCVATNVGSTGGTGGMTCPLNPAGSGCITAADCAPPNLCQPASDGGGFCGPLTTAETPSAACLTNGSTCSATSGQPCCGGNCVGGKCAPRTACGVGGQGCNVAGDCCNFYKCVQGAGADGNDGGTDGGTCGALQAACALQTDCCSGLICDTSGDGTNDTCIAGPDAGASGSDAGIDGGTTGTDAGTDGGTTILDAGGPTYTGTCQAACSPYIGACDPANGNADCCSGFTCETFTAGSICVVPNDIASTPTYCAGPCSALPCQLGASCLAPTAAGQTDPCAAAGLVCNQYGVCDNPQEGEACLLGGPACQPFANSTVTDIQCLQLPATFGGAYACSQPCALADPDQGTSDCVDPLNICAPLGGSALGAECVPNANATDCNGSPLFGPCNSEGVADGVCLPIVQGTSVGGYCWQATLDGGAPGSACDSNGNRQNGGFCDTSSYCVLGACQAICNSGTVGSPACAQNDAGPTVACQPFYYTGSQFGDPNDTGICSPACDFTSLTGGGCQTVDGVPEKCLPPADVGGADAPTGLCVEAAAPAAQIAVGEPCASSDTIVDTCVPGAFCNFNGYTLTDTCTQLCTNVNSAGQAPCHADQTCYSLFTGLAHQGYCALTSDGGFGG